MSDKMNRLADWVGAIILYAVLVLFWALAFWGEFGQ